MIGGIGRSIPAAWASLHSSHYRQKLPRVNIEWSRICDRPRQQGCGVFCVPECGRSSVRYTRVQRSASERIGTRADDYPDSEILRSVYQLIRKFFENETKSGLRCRDAKATGDYCGARLSANDPVVEHTGAAVRQEVRVYLGPPSLLIRRKSTLGQRLRQLGQKRNGP